MSDPEEPVIPPEGIALGLSGQNAAAFDTDLHAFERDTPTDDRIMVPQNGLVALRKSGGMRFTSRAVIVLRSGWALQQPHDGPSLRPRRVAPAALKALRRLTLRARLGSLPETIGTASPDAYAYELAARIGRQVHRVTVYDGSIPAAVEPLIRALSKLLPEH
jgi:hypothetical protein